MRLAGLENEIRGRAHQRRGPPRRTRGRHPRPPPDVGPLDRRRESTDLLNYDVVTPRHGYFASVPAIVVCSGALGAFALGAFALGLAGNPPAFALGAFALGLAVNPPAFALGAFALGAFALGAFALGAFGAVDAGAHSVGWFAAHA